jgi:hypothetical protein
MVDDESDDRPYREIADMLNAGKARTPIERAVLAARQAVERAQAEQEDPLNDRAMAWQQVDTALWGLVSDTVETDSGDAILPRTVDGANAHLANLRETLGRIGDSQNDAERDAVKQVEATIRVYQTEVMGPLAAVAGVRPAN